MSDKIIDFAEAFEKRKVRDAELEALAIESDKEVADVFSLLTARETLWSLREMGIYTNNNPKAMLDILMIIESTKSLIYRSIGEDYSFHGVSEAVFAESEGDFDMQEMLDEFVQETTDYFDGLDE